MPESERPLPRAHFRALKLEFRRHSLDSDFESRSSSLASEFVARSSSLASGRGPLLHRTTCVAAHVVPGACPVSSNDVFL